ncbi:MAG: transposase [bacterium]
MTQRLIYQNEYPYFITAVTTYRQRVFENVEMAGRLNKIIFNACDLKKFDLLAFCILPDHLHLLVKPQRSLERLRCDNEWCSPPPQSSPSPQRTFSKVRCMPRCDDRYISGLMQSIKGTFSRSIHQGRIWQPRYNFRIVDTPERYYNTLRYIQFNYRKHGLPEKYGQPPYVYMNWQLLK